MMGSIKRVARWMEVRQQRAAGLDTVRDHTFWTGSLGPDAVVVDLGAHLGEFSAHVVERFGCRSLAVEPAPELYARIPANPRIEAVNCAISDHRGVARFHLSSNPEAHTLNASLARLARSDRSVEVTCTTLESLLEEHGIDRVDLLKVDIEGAEIGLFQSCPDDLLDRVAQVTVEFHDFLESFPGREEIPAICRRFESRGFVFLPFSRPYGNHQDVLFLHPERLGMGSRERLRLRALRYGTMAARSWVAKVRSLGAT